LGVGYAERDNGKQSKGRDSRTVQGESEADDGRGDRDAIGFEGRTIARHPGDKALQHFEMFDAQFRYLLR
jgi:hypothetical protein